ncbi:MAG: CCA tRNA nucleotidyltransferase [Kiritimatiellae bacterium]|nr:CCA tRNA nucleotidyltransferase [Kiritimatiellia bacterium]MDD5522283.1 CCA tRNA nucleotidyltransferase [Kiritimatiellia bacterium]
MSSTSKIIPDDKLFSLAVTAIRRLQSAGFTAYLAGGCVRDILLKTKPKDYDIATSASPSEVEHLFPDSITSGKSFAVTRSPVEGVFFEIATFRMDHAYNDGRRPEKVSFTDPETDATRRDFTINAIFMDPVKNEFHDFAGGIDDLKAGIVRCVGDPEKRFAEDHLRMMRAVRFAGVLDFSLHPITADAIRNNSRMLARISPERIHDELTRILMESKKSGDSIILMDKLGLLEVILPEIATMKGQNQPPEFHPEGDVFTHTTAMLNIMEQRSPHLAYAILFHDIGKPATAKIDSGRVRFNGHASEGAHLAEEIMRRLRFSSEEMETIIYCVKNHMRFMDVQKMKRSTLRRLVGAPTFQIEIELHRLDCIASHGDLSNWLFLKDFRKQLAEEPILPKPLITGNDIIAMGIPESPRIGTLRTLAYNAQLEGKFKERKELLEWLKSQISKNR